MFCHRCGTQVASGAQFCPGCGTSLAPETVQPSALPAAPFAAAPGIRSQTGRWIGEGWALVKQDLGVFVVLGILFAVLNGMVPLLLQGPLTAGVEIFCMKKLMGRRAEFSDMFTGFNFFVPTLVVSLLTSVFVFAGTLLCIIPGLVLAAMYQFAYLFVVDKRMDFWPAMQASHAVVRNDYFGFTMFLLALIGVNILGVLCCIVGVLVTIPLTFAAVTVAYRDAVGFEPSTVQTLA
jgi:uncharacterized membrane protein